MSTRIKICGITNVGDAETAAALGADWIGLNFYSKSPRCIDEETALSILRAIPPKAAPVALFVNESLDHAMRQASALGIRTVQMHGDHRESLPKTMNWIPAFSVRGEGDLQNIIAVVEGENAKPYAILVDAHAPGMFGGTGQTAPWHLLAEFKPGVPLILAGGLTPENVADAIRIVRPFAVDVASGVESAPGKKDADRMRRFIDAVRMAE